MARASKQREIVLQALSDNVIHPTAEDLCKIIKKTYSSVGSATVYRNLNILTKDGIIKKINGLETSAHFDHQTHNHYHFICDKCKKIFDISENVAPNINKLAEDETGFQILGHNINFYGICSNCKENEK